MNPTNTVYLVTNLIDGKTYVGVTRRLLTERWTQHVAAAYRCPRIRFHRAIAKHGAENFSVEPIASCFTIEAAQAAERELIRTWAPVYNQTNGGEVTVGRRIPREVVERVAEKLRGQKRTLETRVKMSASKKAYITTHPEYRAALKERGWKAKEVECVELKTVFDSVREAAEGTGLSKSGVEFVCSGRRRKANGLTFRFTDARRTQ